MTRIRGHEWGSAPDFYGPRHAYRESLMLRRLLPTLPGPEVLNAGCGGGSLTLRMACAGLRVTSVDAGEAWLEDLRAELGRRHPGRDLPVLPADLRDLPFPDGAFDGVACGEVLEHLDDDRRACAEMARVLRPGGVLVATVPAGPERLDWVDRWAGHRRRYTADGLAERLRGAGFADVRVAAWGFPVAGLYHRYVYRPMLRRRLRRTGAPGGAGRGARLAGPPLRALMEVDTLFLGRRPGFHGLLAWARR